MPTIKFLPEEKEITVEVGSVISDAIEQAGLRINLPCGGQGRCGRCVVRIISGSARRRSVVRLSSSDIENGLALACHTLTQEEDLVIEIPPQDEMIVRRLPAEEHALPSFSLPLPADWRSDPALRQYYLVIDPPSLADNTADMDRVVRAMRKRDKSISEMRISLPLLRRLARELREADWEVTATVEYHDWTTASENRWSRLVDISAGLPKDVLLGIAIDIGTTSNVVYLVDMISGEIVDTATEYNAQISCGEDIISRIIYARRPDGLSHLQSLVMGTLNGLIERLAERNKVRPPDIQRASVAGNTTMIHLFLAVNPEPLRLEPYIPTIIHPYPILAEEIGLEINPDAIIDCLPAVGSYVGADITGGVLASQMHRHEELALFIDVGTNGEMVLGNSDWLITCACSAGPAFEGAGVHSGMRATAGAIEEVWIDVRTGEPTYHTIGNTAARGICGSGIISLLAELFVTGLLTKGGRFSKAFSTQRLRQGEHGMEYIVAWKDETEDRSEDLVLTETDISNLLRAKAAIYAGFSTLTRSVGIQLSDVQRIFIGGAFGKYLNIEKAIEIGLLPDMPHDRFSYLGNTSAQGAYAALLSAEMRQEVIEIAKKMTYLELSADNTFTEEFMSAMFLPHTELETFPTVAKTLAERQTVPREASEASES